MHIVLPYISTVDIPLIGWEMWRKGINTDDEVGLPDVFLNTSEDCVSHPPMDQNDSSRQWVRRYRSLRKSVDDVGP
jgi:hypothetical protein